MTLPVKSTTSIKEIGKFLLSTIDGIYALTLSVIFLAMAVWALADGFKSKTDTDWNWILATFFSSVLFIVVFVRHRIGVSVSNKKPIIFSMISNSALALAVIYNHYWR